MLFRQPAVTSSELAELEHAFGSAEVKKALGSLVYPPPPPQPAPSPAFLERQAQLRRRYEQREYARMMSNAVPAGSMQGTAIPSASPEHTGVGASAFRQSLIGMNMVIAAGCAYLGGYFLAGQYGRSKTERSGWGLGAMVTILMVEMVLFIIRANKFDKYDKIRQKQVDAQFVPVGVHYEEQLRNKPKHD